MRVLLTGAGGFIGHHVLQHLLINTDWDITATDSFRHKGKTDRIAEVLAASDGHAARTTLLVHDLAAPGVPLERKRDLARAFVGEVEAQHTRAARDDILKFIDLVELQAQRNAEAFA